MILNQNAIMSSLFLISFAEKGNALKKEKRERKKTCWKCIAMAQAAYKDHLDQVCFSRESESDGLEI